MNIDRVFWIGGSPCSGKSTVAELIARRYGMQYYKLDDRLDELMRRACANGGRCAAGNARALGYSVIINDGSEPIETMYSKAVEFLELK